MGTCAAIKVLASFGRGDYDDEVGDTERSSCLAAMPGVDLPGHRRVTALMFTRSCAAPQRVPIEKAGEPPRASAKLGEALAGAPAFSSAKISSLLRLCHARPGCNDSSSDATTAPKLQPTTGWATSCILMGIQLRASWVTQKAIFLRRKPLLPLCLRLPRGFYVLTQVVAIVIIASQGCDCG